MQQDETVKQMPVLFVGHGSPMNAIEDNQWSRAYRQLLSLIPKPRAIVAVSAHWYTEGTQVTMNKHMPTIHDFGGFPPALYEMQYPASGDPQLAARLRDLLGEVNVLPSDEWGLDHGIWTILHWMYPAADIPVIQLSMDRGLDVVGHYQLGKLLRPLREQGVLIMASGNITHNLADAFTQMRQGTAVTPDWARRFDEAVKHSLLNHDHDHLLSIYPDEADAQIAHPTAEHWLPLLYAAGAADRTDEVRFPIEGFDVGSLSMRSVQFG